MSDDDKSAGYAAIGSGLAAGAGAAYIGAQQELSHVARTMLKEHQEAKKAFLQSEAGKKLVDEQKAEAQIHEQIGRRVGEGSTLTALKEGEHFTVTHTLSDAIAAKGVIPSPTPFPELKLKESELPAYLRDAFKSGNGEFSGEALTKLGQEAENALHQIKIKHATAIEDVVLAEMKLGLTKLPNGGLRPVLTKAGVAALGVGAIGYAAAKMGKGHAAAQETRRDAPTERTPG